MKTEYIYILGNDKLDNFIEFIKANMKTAKIETPYCIGGQCWNLQVSYEEEDNDKISKFKNLY